LQALNKTSAVEAEKVYSNIEVKPQFKTVTAEPTIRKSQMNKRRPEEKNQYGLEELRDVTLNAKMIEVADAKAGVREALKDMQINDKVGFEQLVALIKFLSFYEIDFRQLNIINLCFQIKDKGYLEFIPLSTLIESLNKVFGDLRNKDEICNKLVTYFINSYEPCDIKNLPPDTPILF
jgi:hypothetical protein